MQLKELGDEGLEERLQSATQSPARPAHRLTQLVADTVPTGRPVLVLELSRGGQDAATSEQLGDLAAKLVAAGADALAVKTDAEVTPEPLKDLLAVTQAATAAAKRRSAAGGAFTAAAQVPPPVLQRDWFIHPLQVGLFRLHVASWIAVGAASRPDSRRNAPQPPVEFCCSADC